MEDDAAYSASAFYCVIFQSTSSAWRTTSKKCRNLMKNIFQSTSSAWRTTIFCHYNRNSFVHFNPRPPHGGRLLIWLMALSFQNISIHVLRMEDDIKLCIHYTRRQHFNPRPPHGGRLFSAFLSPSFFYFNPRPPHGGRPT